MYKLGEETLEMRAQVRNSVGNVGKRVFEVGSKGGQEQQSRCLWTSLKRRRWR